MFDSAKTNADKYYIIMGDESKPFFASKEEAWMFVEDIADDLYKMMNTINRDAASLAHIGESNADLETLRYLVRKCWEHYHQRSDDLFDEYHDSDEYKYPHPAQVIRDDFDKDSVAKPPTGFDALEQEALEEYQASDEYKKSHPE